MQAAFLYILFSRSILVNKDFFFSICWAIRAYSMYNFSPSILDVLFCVCVRCVCVCVVCARACVCVCVFACTH